MIDARTSLRGLRQALLEVVEMGDEYMHVVCKRSQGRAREEYNRAAPNAKRNRDPYNAHKFEKVHTVSYLAESSDPQKLFEERRTYEVAADARYIFDTREPFTVDEVWDTPDEQGVEEKKELFSALWQDACEAIDNERREYETAISEPASADHVATVALAVSRRDIGQEELQALYDAYSSNYQLGQVIRERAERGEKRLDNLVPAHDAELAKSKAYDLLRARWRVGYVPTLRYFCDDSDRLVDCIIDAYQHRDVLGQIW